MNVRDLVTKLHEASYAYYNYGNSPMTDDEYDAAVELLRKVAPESPYLSEIGAKPASGSSKVYHSIPMGTLSKYHTDEEVLKWIEDPANTKFTKGILVSPKYDGFGVELVYVDGVLKVASTRGTGRLGEDITESVQYMYNVPTSIGNNMNLIVRGEAIIPVAHRALFEDRGYKSLRNAVPGIVRSVDKDLLKYVHFVAYNAFGEALQKYNSFTQSSIRRLLDMFDFEVEDTGDRIHTEFRTIKDRYEFIRDNPGTYEYDGVVLKDNRIQEDNWFTPAHQIAWKFQSKVQITTLRNIEYQVGTTGRFTPVAVFDPVCFQGATLTRASLGSYARYRELITSKGMKIGSQISITRQGDIIPYVKDVVVSDGFDEDTHEIVEPDHCPHCGEDLYIIDNNLVCINKKDPFILAMKISYYISGIGAKGIGMGIITKLVKAGYLKSVSDIYNLDPTTVSIKGWGPSAIEKWRALQTKSLQLLEVLANYPFENCGSSTWSKIIDAIGVPAIISEITGGYGYLKVPEPIKGISEDKIHDINYQIQKNQEDLSAILKKVIK